MQDYIVTLRDDDTVRRVALGVHAHDEKAAVRVAVARARSCRHAHTTVLGVVHERVL